MITGAVYHYKITSDLNENIINLNIPNDWILNQKSFTSQEPSEYDIKVYEESTLYTLSIEVIHRLIAQSQSFLQLGKTLYDVTLRVDFFDNNNTPDEKYLYILKNKPDLFQNFPQKMIASYLKITPETLSRVRKKYVKVF